MIEIAPSRGNLGSFSVKTREKPKTVGNFLTSGFRFAAELHVKVRRPVCESVWQGAKLVKVPAAFSEEERTQVPRNVGFSVFRSHYPNQPLQGEGN